LSQIRKSQLFKPDPFWVGSKLIAERLRQAIGSECSGSMQMPTENNTKLQLPKKKARFVDEVVDELANNHVIDAATADRIRAHIQPMPFDWRRLARYSFIVAIVCVVIAVGAAVADRWLMDLFERVFSIPWTFKSVASAGLAAGLIFFGLSRRQRHPRKIFSNEAIFFLGVLGIAGSIGCLGKALDNGSGHFSLLLLLATAVYGVLGVLLESKLIWVFSLLSLGGWFGAETGYVSGWGAYYLGMAYPLRFVVFGTALTAASWMMSRRPRFSSMYGVTRVVGLLYLFIALWILSIWGNYEGYDSWHRAGHWELLHWSVYFGLAAAGAIYLGLRNDDGVLRGFGLTFLGINLYTRFFEFFWDDLNKAVIFGILGVTFWLIGSRAETLWQMRGLREKVRPKSD
jgi:hypothetical protein